MATIEKVVKNVQNTPFLFELLSEFVVRGLGSLPGRETTIAVVDLLLKHHSEWSKHPPNDFELARLLRTSPRKIRNIRDEIAYRDTRHDDDWCEKRLAAVLKTAQRLQDGAYVTFQIDDGLIRDYAQKLVRENYGVFESGINSSVVKISGETFMALVMSLLNPDDRQSVIDSAPDNMLIKQQDAQRSKTPLRLFIESFSSAAGKEAGKQSVDLAFTLLTGGGNKISQAMGLVRGLFSRGD